MKSLGGGVKSVVGGIKSLDRKVKSLGRVMEKSLGGGSKVPRWWCKDPGS